MGFIEFSLNLIGPDWKTPWTPCDFHRLPMGIQKGKFFNHSFFLIRGGLPFLKLPKFSGPTEVY